MKEGIVLQITIVADSSSNIYKLENVNYKYVSLKIISETKEYVDNPDARTADMSSQQITECAANFCDEIEKSGREVMIYFNREIGYFEYDLAGISGYDFWLAEYCEYPTFIYKFNMWQYTDSGTVNGINSSVDMNIYFPPEGIADENITQYG